MTYWTASVYLLCLVTSTVCAALLVRAFRRSRSRLLLWSAACFVMLAFNNLFVVADILLLPEIDLRILRNGATLVGLVFLVYGFVWETE